MVEHCKNTQQHSKPTHPVKFVGGPFDGHLQLFCVPPQSLPQDLLCPVRSVSFESWSHCKSREASSETSESAISSIAVYELLLRQGRWWYQFVGQMPPTVYSGRYTTSKGDIAS